MNKTYKNVDDVEQAFYDAFEERDLETMASVWSRHDEVCCVHPMSHELTDRKSILASWDEIFANAPEIKIEVEVKKRMRVGDTIVSIVHELLSVPEDNKAHPPVIATNIYQHHDGNWNMISHHGSPTPKLAGNANTQSRTVH